MTAAINASKLRAALRARFASPADVLKRLLGADADLGLLNAGGKPTPGGGRDAVKALATKIQSLISEIKHELPETAIKKLLEILNEHTDRGALPDNDPHAESVRAIKGGDAEPNEGKFCDFLRNKVGLSEDDIEHALHLGKMPKNALGGVTGDARMAFDRMFPEAARVQFEPPLHDRRHPRPVDAAVIDDFAEMFPNAGRIQVGSA